MTMLPTTAFDFGDVVVVRFPFSDQSSGKQRPAVVVSSKAYNEERPDVVLMAITSRLQSPLRLGEALVEQWEAAGLLKPSMLKPVLVTAEKSIIRRHLGHLSENDKANARRCLNQILGV